MSKPKVLGEADLLVQSRRSLVSQLVVEGHTRPAKIKEALKSTHKISVSSATVAADLKTIKEEWRAKRVHNYDEALGRELDKINNHELTAWGEWEKSKHPRRKKATRELTSADTSVAKKNEVYLAEEERLGDPKYLDTVKWCISKRCTLLGLEDRVAVTETMTFQSTRQLDDLSNDEIKFQLDRVLSGLSMEN